MKKKLIFVDAVRTPPQNGKGMCLTTDLAHRQSFQGLIFVVEYEELEWE